MANVLRYFPTQALNFAFKDTIKGLFKTSKDAPQSLKFATNIASGGAAGTMSLLFVYSLDYARTRLANDAKGKGGERQFKGLVDVYVKTLKSDGIQGLYRGFTISAVCIFIYRGMYFGLYDTLKPLLLGKDAEPSQYCNCKIEPLINRQFTLASVFVQFPTWETRVS